MMKKTLIAVLICAAVASCGSDDGGPPTGQTDLFFAQRMILHHTQSVEVAKLVPGQTANAKVLDLATRIEQAREPEIRQLSDWVGRAGAAPGVSSEAVAGRMSADDVAQLGKITGSRFDIRWLDEMIVHHRGALEMAETELNQGSNAQAKALAQRIVDSHQAELDQMQGMTGG